MGRNTVPQFDQAAFDEFEKQVTEIFFSQKGINIGTVDGLQDAKAFLETATWNDMFVTEAPEDYDPDAMAVDMFSGSMRLSMMKSCIDKELKKARVGAT